MRELDVQSPKPPKREWRRHGVALTYFIRGETTGLITIGSAWDPWERIGRLQIGSPDKLTLLGIIPSDMERGLHMRFQEHRSHGEWFRPAPEMLAYIEAEAVDYFRWVSRGQKELLNEVLSRPSRPL